MALVGRKRTSNPLGLDPKKHARLYGKHGAFYYAHRSGKWERLGTDLADAKRKAAHYNDPDGTYGTCAWYLDQFLAHCEARVKKALEAVEGVASAEVSHEKGTAVVTLSKDVPDAVLKKAVEDQDYAVAAIE